MPHDTRSLNSDRSDIDSLDDIWLFGYGSLIYKVDFPYLEVQPVYLNGWQRRFWQGSHDHRGTPDAPGRVVTLVEAHGERCFGLAYRVEADVFDHLDHREKNGYRRLVVALQFGPHDIRQGLVYIGLKNSPAFLGEASEEAIAAQILRSVGPSGSNRDYLEKLVQALAEYKVHDPHVDAVYKKLLALEASTPAAN